MRLTKRKFDQLDEIDEALQELRFSIHLLGYDDISRPIVICKYNSLDSSSYLIKSIIVHSDVYDEDIFVFSSVRDCITQLNFFSRIYKYNLKKSTL